MRQNLLGHGRTATPLTRLPGEAPWALCPTKAADSGPGSRSSWWSSGPWRCLWGREGTWWVPRLGQGSRQIHWRNHAVGCIILEDRL